MRRNQSDGFEHLNARLYQNYGRPSNNTTPRGATPRDAKRAVSAGAGASARLTQQYQQLANGSSNRLQKGRPQPKQAPAAQPWRREVVRDRRSPPRQNSPLRNETPRSMMSMGGGGNVRELLSNIVELASQIAESADHEPRPVHSENNGLKAQEIERVVQKVQLHFADKINKLTQERNDLQLSRDDVLRRLQDEQQQRLLGEEQSQLLASNHERVVLNLEERSRRLQQQNRQLQELLHRKNSEGTSKEVLEPFEDDLRSDSPAVVESSHNWLHRPAFDESGPMVEVEMSVQRLSEPVDSVGQLHRMTPMKTAQRPHPVTIEEDVNAFLDSISKDIADLELA